MQNQLLPTLLSGLFVLAVAGCSSGNADQSSSLRIHCINGDAFCLISCDLGCGQTGCSVTEIAENQRLRFVFSDRIDPASVTGASVSIRTTTGVAPDGDFLVQDRELTFVPRVRTVNGTSTFGFLRNESYVITLNAGATGQGVRSTSGAGLKRELSCTVVVSRGIQDEDQLPPSVELVSPASTGPIPLRPTVVLRFSELIDTTALQGALSTSSPVQFLLKGTTTLDGDVVCDSQQVGVALEGIPSLAAETVAGRQVTVLTFTPDLELPGNACLTINVTGEVRDLSGRQGTPATFELLTEAGAPHPVTITESFATNGNQVVEVSTVPWNNGARPGLIGNDGRHGSFDVTMGVAVAPSVYEWNTDSFLIPASASLTGTEYLVTDGKFYFTDFVLPAGTTLRFSGTVPPQIWVRGKAEIGGTIDISAPELPFWVPAAGSTVPAAVIGQHVSDFNGIGPSTSYSVAVPNFATGQEIDLPGMGGAGGVGGGRGGRGGDECRLDGDVTHTEGLQVVHDYYGRNGEDVKVQAGHAYAANVGGTGGKGSLLHPITGVTTNVPAIGTPAIYRGLFAPGGGGGGFSLPGGQASVTTMPTNTSLGPIQVAGVAFNLLPLPTAPGFSSLNHFVVGGSGGGGGGSHAYGTQISGIPTPTIGPFVAGAAGSGGGGAMAIRVGGNLAVLASAVLVSKGGAGVLITGDNKNTASGDSSWGVSSPGGGGSGGSFLLQAGGTLTFAGQLDVSGGLGSRTGSVALSGSILSSFSITSKAGDGSPGFYRLEAGAGAPSFSGTGVPAFNASQNGAPLTDRDPVTGGLSKWRSSGQFFPPQWLRYELDVDLDGDGTVDITYTDSGAAGTQAAVDPNGPVRIQFQGANLNQTGDAPLPGTLPPWRDGIGSGAGPGIGLDSVTGFRFQLLFNGAVSATTVVRALRVFAQT
jgi:hypothetical protein